MIQGALRTRAAALPSAHAEVAGMPLVLWLALASGLVRYAGAVWDVSWHRTIGRDTFWSPPHVALYAAVTVGMFAAAWALRERPTWFYWVALLGNALTILSAPVDDAWHRMYGRDVDIWSPPHLMAVAASALSLVGWVVAMVPHARGAIGRAACALMVGFLLYAGWFALNWYQMAAVSRDALEYPALLLLVQLPVLVWAAATGRWRATEGALAFTLLVLAPMALFSAIGWRAPAAPPATLLVALAVDAVRPSAGATRVVLSAALAALLALGHEVARVALLPPPAPSGSEAPLLIPYLNAAALHPLTREGAVAALPLVLLAALTGAALGAVLARVEILAPSASGVRSPCR